MNATSIDVWMASFDALLPSGKPDSGTDWQLLSADERNRADKFRFELDRIKYIACRALLRRLLGEATGVLPEAVRFAYLKHGKPQVVDGPAFNLSHCTSHCAIAIGGSNPIGIDVEAINETIDINEIAAHVFSVQEQKEVDSFAAFYRCWTRKEALIKAIGDGMQLPLQDFDVALERAGDNLLLASRLPNVRATDWQIIDLDIPHGLFGALATRSAPAITLTKHWVSAPGSTNPDSIERSGSVITTRHELKRR